MRLDHLCDLELAYRLDDQFLDEGFDLVLPYGTEEGTGYGEGDATSSSKPGESFPNSDTPR